MDIGNGLGADSSLPEIALMYIAISSRCALRDFDGHRIHKATRRKLEGAVGTLSEVTTVTGYTVSFSNDCSAHYAGHWRSGHLSATDKDALS